MRKLVGIVGDGVSRPDPLSPRTWSGLSRNFFLECQRRELLARAFGVGLPAAAKYFYAARNFRLDRATWRRLLFMDIGFRQTLTRQASKELTEQDFQCDLLQIGSFFSSAAAAGGKARCFSYHDGNFAMALRSAYFPPRIPRPRIDAVLDYEKQTARAMDRVFTTSEYLRRSFIDDYGLAPDKVACIGAGINIDLPPAPENKDYETGEILFIGVEFRRKGGEQLLRAFRVVRERVPGATLHIVGPPRPEGQEADLRGVVWHGFLRKNDPAEAAKLDSLFRSASLFVMPSIYEPFGVAPLEAMAHGVPCVVSDDWALPEVVPRGVCGELTPPGEWEPLAEAISQLLRDPDRLARYGEAGRRHVEAEFTWARVVDRLIAALPANEAARQTTATV